jgi:enediyne polyketide synthase
MISLRCSKSEAEKIVHQVDGYLVLANINGPQQIVFSGKTEAVKKAVEAGDQRGIQSKEIQVSNAFHSKLASHAAQVIKNETFLNKKSGKSALGFFQVSREKKSQTGYF